jgi:hypothetical protein
MSNSAEWCATSVYDVDSELPPDVLAKVRALKFGRFWLALQTLVTRWSGEVAFVPTDTCRVQDSQQKLDALLASIL